MKFYVQIPSKNLVIVDPDTDQPASGSLSHRELVRALMKSPKVTQSLDFCDLYDLRKKLLDAAPGSCVELSDEEHAALVAEAKRPSVLTPAALYSPDIQAFLHSIVNAPTTKPSTLRAAK